MTSRAKVCSSLVYNRYIYIRAGYRVRARASAAATDEGIIEHELSIGGGTYAFETMQMASFANWPEEREDRLSELSRVCVLCRHTHA